MNDKKYICLIMLFCIAVISTLFGQKADNKIIINADLGQEKISRHIYGHFSEHLGRCIYEGFWVGPDSPVPNENGIRKDVVDALRDIGIPNLRWPGGCFADEYHWKDGIGSKEDRPTMINTHWGGVTEDNSFGTHEFMELCQQLDCEPVICGNLGSGTIHEMSQWVEYFNSDNVSPMTKLRAENGREKSWHVKFWNLGNENWGCGGNMTAEYYADVMRRYSTYCKDYGDNKLYRVACGPSADDFEWMETLMKDPKNRNMFQGISLHYYTGTWSWESRSATQFEEDLWFKIIDTAYKIDKIITAHKMIMDQYDPENTKGLIVDEWGVWYEVEPGTNPGFLYQQNTLRDAMVASLTLDVFNNHCDRVKMANIAQVVNVLQAMILTKEDQIVLTPTFYVFKMYKVHHEATLLPLNLTCEEYSYGEKSVPALSASASKDDNGLIHITMTNLNPNKNIKVSCELRGENKKLSVKNSEVITAEKMNAYNDFGKPEAVNINEFDSYKIKKNNITVELPAKSVVMIEL